MADEQIPPIDPPDPRQPARSPLWLRLVLFGSLAINIAVVGIVVGAMAFRGPSDHGAPRLRDAGLGPLGAVLTREQRAALRERLQTHAPDLRQNRERMREDFRRLLDALRAEPFDPAAIEDILAAQRRTILNRQEIGHRALIEAISQATPEARRRMADRLERALRRGARDGRGGP